ncbi:MAG: DUF2442 domain-containing protein [Candidatus Obscuribacterales bacterium]|nr:DUF2442 domain-containing protein [Candidatus Obscuribacterales bacterium]
MSLLRIRHVKVLSGFTVRLTLTDGSTIDKDISNLLNGPIFEPLRNDPAQFSRVSVQDGTLVWTNGADLCPDVLIWNGIPPIAN